MNKRNLLSCLFIAGLLLLAACDGQGDGAAQTDEGISADRADSYESIEEVAADADLVITAEALDQRTVENEGRDEFPYTTTTVSVMEVLHGELAEDSVEVRQMGHPDPDGELHMTQDIPPLLEAGNEYMLFLSEHRDSGVYMIVGVGAGMYAVADTGELEKLDEAEASGNLPDSMTDEEVQEALTRQ